jgi:DNA-binding XRE family transcriptional regulator
LSESASSHQLFSKGDKQKMEVSTKRIERCMASQGLTQTVLAEKAGITRQTLSTVLAKGRGSTLTAFKIARGLGVDIEQILDD